MDEVEIFCQFPNPWTLRVSGMGSYTSKCEKKSKSLHPNEQYIICICTTTVALDFKIVDKNLMGLAH